MDHPENVNKAVSRMHTLYCSSLEGMCAAYSFSIGWKGLEVLSFYVTFGTIFKVEVAVILPEDWQDLLQRLWPLTCLRFTTRRPEYMLLPRHRETCVISL